MQKSKMNERKTPQPKPVEHAFLAMIVGVNFADNNKLKPR